MDATIVEPATKPAADFCASPAPHRLQTSKTCFGRTRRPSDWAAVLLPSRRQQHTLRTRLCCPETSQDVRRAAAARRLVTTAVPCVRERGVECLPPRRQAARSGPL